MNGLSLSEPWWLFFALLLAVLHWMERRGRPAVVDHPRYRAMRALRYLSVLLLTLGLSKPVFFASGGATQVAVILDEQRTMEAGVAASVGQAVEAANRSRSLDSWIAQAFGMPRSRVLLDRRVGDDLIARAQSAAAFLEDGVHRREVWLTNRSSGPRQDPIVGTRCRA